MVCEGAEYGEVRG